MHKQVTMVARASLIAAMAGIFLASCASSDRKSSMEPTKVAATEKDSVQNTTQPKGYQLDDNAVFAPVQPDGIDAVYLTALVDEVAADYVTPPEADHAPEMRLSEVPTPSVASEFGQGIGYFLGEAASDSRNEESGFQLPPPIPGAPALTSSFGSTDFDTNVTHTGFGFIPPDPMGAAGPSHLVNVVNVTVRFHQKNGTLDFDSSLANFFSVLSPANFTFDPKVIYDQSAGRFLVVTLEKVDDGTCAADPDCTSRILVGVSDDSNPNGTWYMTAINSELSIENPPSSGTFSDHWADYPGFAVDEEAVYINANMFEFPASGGSFGGVRLWVIGKGIGSGGFYDGMSVSVSLLNPYAATPAFATTTQPAHIYGSPPSNVGTFLVSHSGLSDGTNEAVQVVRLDNPLTSPTFVQEIVNVGNITDDNTNPLPDAAQSGTSTLVEVNDRRALDAVWRNDSLWLTATILPNSGPDTGETTAYWWELDTSTLGSTAVADQGAIGGEDIATDTTTFFPSIAVNDSNGVAIGFSASAATIFAGSYYTTRTPWDTPGTNSGSATLRAGLDSYVRTFGGPRNRWGDYSGMVVDPSTDCFWVYNEHAIAGGSPSGGEDGRWGTAFGEVCIGATTICPSTSVLISNEDLTGEDERKAQGTITLGPSVTVKSGADVLLQSGTSVVFENGFTVESNASLEVAVVTNGCQ